MATHQSQAALQTSHPILFAGKTSEEFQTNVIPTQYCSGGNSVSLLLPPGTFDTHVHIFDPKTSPYAPTRAYTPETATLSDLLVFSRSISSRRQPSNFVIVQPSPYRTDNRVLLSTLRDLQGNGLFVRAIGVVDVDTVTDEELRHMHDLGVRGLRLNMQSDGHVVSIPALRSLLVEAAARISHLSGWKLQLYAPASVWQDLHNTILGLPVVVIADHTGGLLAASKMDEPHMNPLTQPGFESLVALAKASKVIIKVSGLYRSSTEDTTAFADIGPLIKELAAQVPDRLIWASDWPHTGEGKDRMKMQDLQRMEPFRKIDNLNIIANLRGWLGTEENWLKMMVHNPRREFT